MKNGKELTKMILEGLLFSGAVVIAGNNPRFFKYVFPKIVKFISYKIKNNKEKKKVYDTFYRLKNRGLIKFEYRGRQLYVSLTKEGREKAGKYQIDDLKIDKSKKWDKKWRVLIFDISDKQKIKREALRGKLKELRLFQLQKSVWVCPYNFKKEMEVLRNFFALKTDEMKVISAYEIERDEKIKLFFNLK